MAHHSSILDREHDEIIEQLEDASTGDNGTSRLFREMRSKFLTHLEKENETIIPLLSYVKETANGAGIGKNSIYITAGEKFNRESDTMVSEHRTMQNLVGNVMEQLKIHPDGKLSKLARILLEHIEFEEEFLYPSAKMAARTIKLEQETSRMTVR
jgi:hemerythrin superfamily protein